MRANRSAILAILFAIAGVVFDNKFLEVLMAVFVAACVSYSVNRYTDMFKNDNEIKGLAKNVAEQLFIFVCEIIDESRYKKLTPEDEHTISRLCGIIKLLENYHSLDIEPLKAQQYVKIEEGKAYYRNPQLYTSSFDEYPLEIMDKALYSLGDKPHSAGSGSHWRIAFQQIKESNKFMGTSEGGGHTYTAHRVQPPDEEPPKQ